MKECYFDKITRRLIDAAMQVNDNAKSQDVNRNHVNYGCCISWSRVLMDMGHIVDAPAYEDDGFLKIASIEIDGGKMIEFEKRR